MMTDFRALCAELTAWAEKTSAHYFQPPDVLLRARAALAKADEPAVPEGREPVSVITEPSDQELLDIAASTIEPYECSGITTDEYEPETECAVEAYGSELIAFARAVLARWGNPAPPPDDGEVAELVAALQSMATDADRRCRFSNAERLSRAAELLQRQVPVPVPVSERLPEPSTKVLAHYFNDLGRKRTICAIWVPAKSRSGDIGDDDDFTEYDEEDGKFYWPEGWYEAIENWHDLGWIHVEEGEVVYWQPLPKWPAHDLPVPEVGE